MRPYGSVLLIGLILLCPFLGGHERVALASEWLETLTEGLDYNIRALTSLTIQQAADSPQNPNNDFVQLPTYIAEMEFRPDVRLSLWHFDFSVKPRLNLAGTFWDGGMRTGDRDMDADVFVNEWLARLRLTDSLFVSYGRENLQWGPSFLFSPSNPFFRDNGRLNPKREVRGSDFARLVWLPGNAWTLSLIANVDAGRQEFRSLDFRRTYAMKLDYVGSSAYASLISAYQEDNRYHVGWYGGWTVTDALLVYMEGAVIRGVNALFPVADASPLGATMEVADAFTWDGVILLGASYTLTLGPTLTVEYVYDSVGYNADQARTYDQLRQRAADAFLQMCPIRDLGRLTLSQTLDPGLRFTRQHFVLLQYVHQNFRDVFNLTFRWTQSLEDHSGQFNYIFEYLLGDHLQWFSVGTINVGDRESVFGSFLDHQILIGLEVFF
jgi:hypothetical protein